MASHRRLRTVESGSRPRRAVLKASTSCSASCQPTRLSISYITPHWVDETVETVEMASSSSSALESFSDAGVVNMAEDSVG